MYHLHALKGPINCFEVKMGLENLNFLTVLDLQKEMKLNHEVNLKMLLGREKNLLLQLFCK